MADEMEDAMRHGQAALDRYVDRDGRAWWRCPGERGGSSCDFFTNAAFQHLPLASLLEQFGPLSEVTADV